MERVLSQYRLREQVVRLAGIKDKVKDKVKDKLSFMHIYRTLYWTNCPIKQKSSKKRLAEVVRIS
jgi:hypothetical protein